MLPCAKLLPEQGLQSAISTIISPIRIEIFRTILKPVLNDLYAKIYSHDANQMSIEVFTNSDYQQESVQEYIDLVSEHRARLRMLLFQAQGSSLENFRSEYTDK